MNIPTEISNYINSLPEQKRNDITALHHQILESVPNCRLWFLDGKNDEGKVISNPNIGYGTTQLHYKDGKSKEFYQIGLSANTTGISVYFMGIEDKNYLTRSYGNTIGKATITGYCIKFRSLKDIDITILLKAIRERIT
jgi:Domain of unknown function (DU1801)